MKKLIALAAAVAAIAGLWGYVGNTAAAQATGSASEPLPHKTGLIDMGHVFKNYKKFEALRSSLEAEVKAYAEQDKTDAEKLKALQTQLQALAKTVTETSPEYKRLEQQLSEASAKYQADRRLKEREFARKDAEIFKTVYLEVSEFVKKYAEWKQYTLVLRFERDDPSKAQDLQQSLQQMNRQVVYFKPHDDISDDIVMYLNQAYERSASRPASPAAGTRR